MTENETGWTELIEGVDKMKDKVKVLAKKRKDLNKEEKDFESSMLQYTRTILRRQKQLEESLRGELELVMEKLESAVEQQQNQQVQQREEQIKEKDKQLEQQRQKFKELEGQLEQQAQKYQVLEEQSEQQLQKYQALEEQSEQQMQKYQALEEQSEQQKQKFQKLEEQFKQQFQENENQLKEKDELLTERDKLLQQNEDQLQQLSRENADKDIKIKNMESRINQILEEQQMQQEEQELLLEGKTDEYNAMERRLKKELSKEQEQNGQLTEELELYRSELGDRDYYRSLKSRVQRDPIFSSVISVESYEEYVARYSSEDTIGFLYEYFKTDIYRMSEPQCRMLDEFFDHCLLLHNQLYPTSLFRQNVQQGDMYYFDEHEKAESFQASGEIKQVLLPGIIDEHGLLFRDCKAYVVLKS